MKLLKVKHQVLPVISAVVAWLSRVLVYRSNLTLSEIYLFISVLLLAANHA